MLGASSYLLLINKRLRLFFFVVIFSLSSLVNTRYFQNDKYDFKVLSEGSNYASYIRTHTSKLLFDYLPKDINLFKKLGFYLVPKDPHNFPPETLFTPELIKLYHPTLVSDQPEKNTLL